MKQIEEKPKKHILRKFIFFIILIMALIIVYGKYVEPSIIFINEYNVKSNKFPTSLNKIKIVHFSDILFDSSDDMDKLDEIISLINDKKVDIVIFSGDLFKKSYNPNQKIIDKVTEKLSKIKSKYGKYYVTGDNDLKNISYDNIMQNSGFISLNNSFDVIYSNAKESLLLVGLMPNIDTTILNNIINENNANYKIVIFHESDSFEDIEDYNFDLALSSNSLNGKVNIPYIKNIFLNKNSNKYYEPHYKIHDKDLYISNGIGTEGIEFRLFNNPSINIYTLKK